MPRRSHRTLRLTTMALISAIASMSLIGPASAAPTGEPQEAVHAGFDTVPSARSAISPEATVLHLEISSSSALGYARKGVVVVTDPAGSTALAVTDMSTGAITSSLDIGDRIDTVAGAYATNDYDASNAIRAYVWGTKDGAPVLVSVLSGDAQGVEGGTVTTAPDQLDVASLVALGGSSSGLLAVFERTDGTYIARSLGYDLAPVGGEVALPFPADASRTFLIDASYGNIVSFRTGAVDVVSRYATSRLDTLPLAQLGAVAAVDLAEQTLAVVDEDGDLAVMELGFMSAPTLTASASTGRDATGVAVQSGLEEVMVSSAGGDSLARYGAGTGDELTPVDLGGVEILPGSLDAQSATGAVVFQAATGDSVHGYSSTLQRGVSFYVHDGNVVVSSLSTDTRGGGIEFSFAAEGTGRLTSTWEYSLDGGASWASRGASWESAITDAGSVNYAPAALAAEPLDGVAPSTRTIVDVEELAPRSTYSAWESARPVDDAGYDALWRVRVSGDLGSVASEPQRILIRDEVDPGEGEGEQPVGEGPEISRQPVSASVAQSERTILSVAAEDAATTYRWERSLDGGTSWSEVSGASGAELAVTGRLHEDGAQYRAIASNGTGSTTSTAATVTVTAPGPVEVEDAPEGATAIADGSLHLDLSEYAHEWARYAWGDAAAVSEEDGFAFSDGTGWVDPRTGAAVVAWSGAGIYTPYGGYNGIHLTAANPVLTVDADGTGTLTADVAWNNGGGMGGAGSTSESDGFRRVELATFSDAQMVVAGDGSATVTAQPDWEGREYIKPGISDATVYPSSFPASYVDWLDDGLRAWFLSTGSSRDPEKAMSTITATFDVAAEPEPGGEAAGGDVEIGVEVPEAGDGTDPTDPTDPGSPEDQELRVTLSGTSAALGTAQRNAAGFAASGSLPAITVTDTRTDGNRFAVSAVASDFTGPAGSAPFSGGALGWTPAASGTATDAVTAGPSVEANAPGLATASTLISGADGHAPGEWTADADLQLQAPTSAQAGSYTATLTITTIG